MPKAPTAVSVRAILADDRGHVLLLQRSRHHAHYVGQWEFPGGKVDEGEDLAQALEREVQEEISLAIRAGAVGGETEDTVDGRRIRTVALAAERIAGQPRLSDEHAAFAWVAPEALASYDLVTTTRALAEQFVSASGGGMKPDAWLDAQVAHYRRVRPEYETAAAGLILHLRAALKSVAPDAMIEGRAKTVASYAEKILRKQKYVEPLREITDLCGIRVVVGSDAEVVEVGRKIRELFEVDEAKSLDALSRLGCGEFGYRSVHYVVRPCPSRCPSWPETLKGLAAEIQVRTWLQHAQAAVDHDRVYKSPCGLPDALRREKARLAAQLESVDAGLQRLAQDIDQQHALLGGALDAHAGEKERSLLATLRRFEPENPSMVLRQIRLAAGQGAWVEAAELLRVFAAQAPSGLELSSELQSFGGYVLCRSARAVGDSDWMDGHRWLRRASEREPRAVATWTWLGEVLTRAKDPEAGEAFRRAYELDPADPAALAGFLYTQRTDLGARRLARLLVPAVRHSLERYARLVESGLESAPDHFRAAWLQLLVDGPDNVADARGALLRGLVAVRRSDEITDALTVMAETADGTVQSEVTLWSRVLQLFRQVRFSSDAPEDWLRANATVGVSPVRAPVVMIAGSCKVDDTGTLADWERLLAVALGEFRGTVISGGTTAGVAGIAGSIGRRASGQVYTLGYVPVTDTHGDAPVRDIRYHETRTTTGTGFSPLEPVQAWIDLVAQGIDPKAVTLLGLGGGEIAAFEYRLALALGARVIVIVGSGGAADALASDLRWGRPPLNLTPLPQSLADGLALEALLATQATPLTLDKLNELGALVHKAYLADNLYSEMDPVRVKWSELREDLKESNRCQVLAAVRILASEGYAVLPAEEAAADAVVKEVSDEELERMAEREHARWNLERLRSGWRYGPRKDVTNKLTPYLVPWTQLTEEIKGYDRAAIRGYAAVLGKAGLAIVRRA